MSERTEANEPLPIRQLPAPDLKALLKSGVPLELVDVAPTRNARARPLVVSDITGVTGLTIRGRPRSLSITSRLTEGIRISVENRRRLTRDSCAAWPEIGPQGVYLLSQSLASPSTSTRSSGRAAAAIF
jgi:hypothetical protein